MDGFEREKADRSLNGQDTPSSATDSKGKSIEESSDTPSEHNPPHDDRDEIGWR